LERDIRELAKITPAAAKAQSAGAPIQFILAERAGNTFRAGSRLPPPACRKVDTGGPRSTDKASRVAVGCPERNKDMPTGRWRGAWQRLAPPPRSPHRAGRSGRRDTSAACTRRATGQGMGRALRAVGSPPARPLPAGPSSRADGTRRRRACSARRRGRRNARAASSFVGYRSLSALAPEKRLAAVPNGREAPRKDNPDSRVFLTIPTSVNRH